MALLDHQVPEEAKQVTVDLLQKCIGNMCVVKYSNGADSRNLVVCGMVTSVVFSEERDLSASEIKLYQGATDFDTISGDDIAYIYSLSMLRGSIPPDAQDLMGPL